MPKIRSTIRQLLFLIFTLSSLLIVSCGDDDDNSSDCSGCDSDAPYSTVSATSCYETLAECESAESDVCQRCN